MEDRQLMDLYYKFIRDHRCQINEKLLDAYNHYYSKEHDFVMKNGSFGAFVVIPLFVVWLIWGNAFKTTQEQLFPALVLIVLGLCIRHYGSNLISEAYRNSFRMREYKDVLLWYVEQCRVTDLTKASDTEKDIINEKYDYFRKYITSEDFHYYKKSKMKKRM